MLTAAEVARLLGLKPRTVYDLASSGKLPFYRPAPGAVRFDPADVEAYRRATQPPPAPMPSQKALRQYLRMYRAADDAAELPALSPEQEAIADARRRNMRMPPWANGAAIRAIYAEARRLTAETGTPHHVDHEIPLQGEFVTGLHVETNLRVMVGIENLRKRNRYEP